MSCLDPQRPGLGGAGPGPGRRRGEEDGGGGAAAATGVLERVQTRLHTGDTERGADRNK
ncbi:hypothetical protein KGM_211959 [Danaus plexippus plexippus]|uniref:Uncharacterized protein n=1 Tax=Danaus plexippus plexippus TaxID=278856 RepID=A0A212FI24_DANPL|nr:hypothetical protein KGM_211959 [Danaus plexippus plexippus]